MQSPSVNQAMEILREMRQITGGQSSVQEKLEQIVDIAAMSKEDRMKYDESSRSIAISWL